MARIAGINIPMNKHVWVGLTSIYGVGRTQARKACEAAGVKPETKVKDLTEPVPLRSASRASGRGDLRREPRWASSGWMISVATGIRPCPLMRGQRTAPTPPQGVRQGSGQAQRASGLERHHTSDRQV
jgi:small subunit ribosomal protein S13